MVKACWYSTQDVSQGGAALVTEPLQPHKRAWGAGVPPASARVSTSARVMGADAGMHSLGSPSHLCRNLSADLWAVGCCLKLLTHTCRQPGDGVLGACTCAQG